jgi:hypothetical protein
LSISDKICLPNHTDEDATEIINFLDDYDDLKGNFDILKPSQKRKCL